MSSKPSTSVLSAGQARSEHEVGTRFYRRLAENSLSLMCCHDPAGALLWINRAAAQSLGSEPEEMIGRSIVDFLIPEARPLFPSYLHRIQNHGSDSGLMRLRARSGAERIFMFQSKMSDDPELEPHVMGHATDVTELFRTKKALRDSFRYTPVGQIQIGADGTLRRINSTACRILGVPEFQTSQINGPSPLTNFCLEITSSGPSPGLVIFTRPDGRIIHLDVYVRRLAAGSSDPGGVMCVLMDVTARATAETRIRNLNAQLEGKVAARTSELRQSNAELREFAHIASHDLQAPLRQVGRKLELLTFEMKDEAAGELVSSARDDVQRMSRLVESLLEYALASNRTKAASVEVPLSIAISESLMNLAAEITSSEAIVTYKDLPELLVAESDFVQLFQNLIGNSLKYRSKNAPRIEITAQKGDHDWMISVQDNGIGIDPAYSERIFEAFRRLHGKEYAGTGMGLAICKKIVERAGGRIWVESQPGQGSSFRFTIPV